MKKIIKVAFVLIMLLGCSSKEIRINNQSIIDKKPLFNLSSLSIETGYNYITGEQKLGLLLSEEAKKRASDSIYFTKFRKGILKLKLLSINVEETKVKNGSFLYIFPAYEKGIEARISYSLSAYSPNGEELSSTTKSIKFSVKEQNEDSKKELVEKILNEFQISIFQISKNELSSFASGR